MSVYEIEGLSFTGPICWGNVFRVTQSLHSITIKTTILHGICYHHLWKC